METAVQKKQRLIRLLHVAKSQLMMDDGEYRKLLANVSCGKTSSTKLSLDELELAVRAVKARGFVVTTKAQQRSGVADIPVFDDARAQMKMIRGLWLELYKMGAVRSASELSLARFAKRMTGVDYHGWLDVDNASRLIEHLKEWQKRAMRKMEVASGG